MLRRVILGCSLVALVAAFAIAADRPLAGLATVPSGTTVTAPEPVAPKQDGVDSILEELEKLKAQREAIERKEKDLRSILANRIDAQRERLGKLGLSPVVVPPVFTPPAGSGTSSIPRVSAPLPVSGPPAPSPLLPAVPPAPTAPLPAPTAPVPTPAY